jgi:hypothetical protein
VAGPAELLERAELILAEGFESAEPWIKDQHDAAAAELAPAMERMAAERGNTRVTSGITPKAVAFKLSVVEAIFRRGRPEHRCPHSKTRTPPPMIVDLGQGMVACLPCAKEYDLPANDDGECDLCEKPTVIFVEFWLELGPALVHGDTCVECNEWLAGV